MRDEIWSLVRPLLLLWISLTCLPSVLLAAVRRRDFSVESFRHRWWARFWAQIGVGASEAAATDVAAILPHASGVVLDVGTGAGHYLRHYDPARVGRLICVEPNAGVHTDLRRRAVAAGLEQKIVILPCRIEDLTAATKSMSGGADSPINSVDTVVTLEVLCSVAHPRETARQLFRLLKPGGEGQWIWYEHVRSQSPYSIVNRYQSLLNLVWPSMIGGCNLCRDTLSLINGIGSWKSTSITTAPPAANAFNLLPHVAGIMVKE